MIGFLRVLPKYSIAAAGLDVVYRFKTLIMPPNQQYLESEEMELYQAFQRSSTIPLVESLIFSKMSDINKQSLPSAFLMSRLNDLDIYKDHKGNDFDAIMLLTDVIEKATIENQSCGWKTDHRDSLLRIFNLNWFLLFDEECYFDEGCYKGQKDLAFQPLIFQPFRDVSTTPQFLALSQVPVGKNFNKQANKIVTSAEKFAKSLGNNLVDLTDYLMNATSEGKLAEVFKQAVRDVALVVTNIFLAVTELVRKILSTMNVKEEDAEKKALSVAEACVESTETAADKFLEESYSLRSIHSTIKEAAGPNLKKNALKAVTQLDEMSKSVDKYAKNLQTERKSADDFIKSMTTD